MTSTWTLIAAFFISGNVFATTTVTSVVGASTYSVGTANAIYGGFVAPETNCTIDATTQACNSCLGGAYGTPCNENGIQPGSLLTINLHTDDNKTQNPQVIVKMTTNAAVTKTDFGGSTVPDASGNYSITIYWSDLCAKGLSGGTSSCLASFTTTLQVGTGTNSTTFTEQTDVKVSLSYIDSTDVTQQFYTSCEAGATPTPNNGYCEFSVFPGDEKVYLDNLTAPSTYPTAMPATATSAVSDIKYNRLRFYYAETTTCDNSGGSVLTALGTIANNFPSITLNVDVSDAGYSTENKLKGLSNDTYYVFSMANMDLAGNIYQFSPNAMPTANLICAKPAKVFGLLDDKRCFIATAAFGSEMDAYVDVLRLFRDQVLRKFSIGNQLVQTYYRNSPPLAQWVAQDETRKAVVRVALWPVIGIAWVVLWIMDNWLLTFSILLILFSGITIRKKVVS